MANKSDKTTNARDLIPFLLKNMNPRVKNELYIYYLQIAWESIVGSQLTEHTLPVKINFTKLIVAVDHQGWSTQLAMYKDKILENIKKTLPYLNIKKLQFVTGNIIPEYKTNPDWDQDQFFDDTDIKTAGLQQNFDQKKSELNFQEKKDIEDCLQQINDKEIKDKFINIFKNLINVEKKYKI